MFNKYNLIMEEDKNKKNEGSTIKALWCMSTGIIILGTGIHSLKTGIKEIIKLYKNI